MLRRKNYSIGASFAVRWKSRCTIVLRVGSCRILARLLYGKHQSALSDHSMFHILPRVSYQILYQALYNNIHSIVPRPLYLLAPTSSKKTDKSKNAASMPLSMRVITAGNERGRWLRRRDLPPTYCCLPPLWGGSLPSNLDSCHSNLCLPFYQK